MPTDPAALRALLAARDRALAVVDAGDGSDAAYTAFEEARAAFDEAAVNALPGLLDERDALRAWVRSAMQGWDLGDEMLAQGRALLGEEA